MNESVPTNSVSAFVCTSGATGLPKAAVITNKRIISALFWWGKSDVIKFNATHFVYIGEPGLLIVEISEVEKALNAFPGISASSVYGVSMPAGYGKAGMGANSTSPSMMFFTGI